MAHMFGARRCPPPPEVVRDRIDSALHAISPDLDSVYAQGQLWFEAPSNWGDGSNDHRLKMGAAYEAAERLFPPYRNAAGTGTKGPGTARGPATARRASR